ncbi:microtubule-associated protein tortifolia1-like protein [Tanacetum coccineum]
MPTTTTAKSSKPPTTPTPSMSTMMELKQTTLNSLTKLSDKDTHHIALLELQEIIKTLSQDTISIFLNTLYSTTTITTISTKPLLKKEAIKLFSLLSDTHCDLTVTHLKKIVSCIVKCLNDPDSGVKEACIDAIGALSGVYLRGGDGSGGLVNWFVKPLFDAMNEQNKWVQSGAALCLGKMVEMCSDDPPVFVFMKMCGRIVKFLNSPNFLANGALLPVVSSLSQAGAISPQYLDPLLKSIHDCLGSSDWSTRKAAADTLNALALHSSKLIVENTTSTITILEACRFDKIKPVRDSITEALLLWKFIAEDRKDQKTPAPVQNSVPPKIPVKLNPGKDSQTKGQNIFDKSTATKKKGPPLSDKELNPEFFQRIERRVSGEVEVVVNGNLQNEEEPVVIDNDAVEKSKSDESCKPDAEINLQDRGLEQGGGGRFSRRREVDNNGSWLGIQRQLLQLERQQAHIMNMLQDFKGGSRDGMVTLENRVWGLERVVEDMARNLSMSMNNLKTSCYINQAFEESSGRSMSKYNGFSDYKSRGSSWNHQTHTRNTQIGLRKGGGAVRFGEGPSARSVWKASKNEATLEAIRGAAPEVPGTENLVKNRDPGLAVWKTAMDGVRAGDMNMAFGELLSSGDDLLLVKLMNKTGPVIDRLSHEVASEILHAVAQFLLEPNLFDICLSWIQQLLDMSVANGTDAVRIPAEVKTEILVNLNEASSTIDPPENWEGLMPNQLFSRLASVWDMNLQQLHK